MSRNYFIHCAYCNESSEVESRMREELIKAVHDAGALVDLDKSGAWDVYSVTTDTTNISRLPLFLLKHYKCQYFEVIDEYWHEVLHVEVKPSLGERVAKLEAEIEALNARNDLAHRRVGALAPKIKD